MRKSHEALTSFKKEMGKVRPTACKQQHTAVTIASQMSKTIQKQQAEINELRTNKRKSDVALIEQTTQLQALSTELVKVRKQRDQLELLCRTLRGHTGRDGAPAPATKAALGVEGTGVSSDDAAQAQSPADGAVSAAAAPNV